MWINLSEQFIIEPWLEVLFYLKNWKQKQKNQTHKLIFYLQPIIISNHYIQPISEQVHAK